VSLPLLVSRNLEVRDRVAAAIVQALRGEAALAELRRLAATLSDVEAVVTRLRRGAEVAEAYHRVPAPPTPLAGALVQGALLFEAGLFFEVHEVLEDVWRGLEDPQRGFVQGLIQIGVAMHHLGHGNPRGATSLFGSGRARVAPHGPVFEGVEVAPLLVALAAWEAAAVSGRWPTALELPPLVVRTADGGRVGARA
jgi:predicted metal-dependent hydrolase